MPCLPPCTFPIFLHSSKSSNVTIYEHHQEKSFILIATNSFILATNKKAKTRGKQQVNLD